MNGMSRNFWFIIAVIVFTTCLADNTPGDVIFVNILFRHGDRTPIDPYPNDPYNNLSYWPEGLGQLTFEGDRGQYELGKWLRQRYKHLLPTTYNRDDIYVQSTDVDRTLMSAYCNLAGMFEPDMSKNWDPTIKWQPIPVHTTPEKQDMVLSGKKPCPKYTKLLEIVKHSDPFKTINDQNQDLYEFLSKKTGAPIKGLYNVETIYNTLFIENLKGLKLPEWTNDVFPDKLQYLAALSFTQNCFTQELARLKIGPLLKEMTDHMKEKSVGILKPDRKAFIYSAHDNTVANVLQSLNIFDVQAPPYLATVMIELRRLNNSDYVTIFYRNSTTTPPYILKLPGCDTLCNLNQFVMLVSCLFPDDWEKECQLSVLDVLWTSDDSGWSTIQLIGYLTAATLLVSLISFLFYKYRNFQQAPRPSTQSYQSLNSNFRT